MSLSLHSSSLPKRIGWSAVAAAAVVSGVAIPASAVAPTGSAMVYVSPNGSSSNGDTSCSDASYSMISDAVASDAVQPGGTVVVCPGTYNESVSILQPLTLRGMKGALLDAAGNGYGIGIGANNVTVQGMTVENATPTQQVPLGDGIVTLALTDSGPAFGNNALIIGNKAINNKGNGIDVNTTVGSQAIGNVTEHDGVGINLTDDLGLPTHNNRIIDNTSNNNFGGCGIVVAEHTGAGVYNNVVSGNTANHNGTGADGAGIFLGGTGGPSGGTHDNVLEYNSLAGNTLGGIAVHVHADVSKSGKILKNKANWAGNRLIGNVIGANNLGFKHKGKVTGDYKDNKHTGIYVGAYYPISLTARNNLIENNHYGVFIIGKVRFNSVAANEYRRDTVRSARSKKPFLG